MGGAATLPHTRREAELTMRRIQRFQCVDEILKGANPNLFGLGGAMPYSATPVALITLQAEF